MSRIETLTGVNELEVMAPRVEIKWDPVTNMGPIIFKMARYLVQDGVIRGDIPPSDGGYFSVQMETMMTRCFVPSTVGDNTLDPVTGTDLTQVSVYGVMVIIKAAFETLYAEHLAAQAAVAPP